ncbi:hypothetical protein BSI_38300 [Bacillus inaquosorum KCTC 13429]|uniref:Uncharacterized protein n=1 Tax=Bacillus inaquosorum KCTC 13429 TaxID=1236548 RepID=A0A9W5PBC3_9BACI|nr:hypothetical protein BSI_38300 [Bacillus inaquosorum KCTC 13429]
MPLPVRKVNLPGYQSDQAPLITKDRIAQILKICIKKKRHKNKPVYPLGRPVFLIYLSKRCR